MMGFDSFLSIFSSSREGVGLLITYVHDQSPCLKMGIFIEYCCLLNFDTCLPSFAQVRNHLFYCSFLSSILAPTAFSLQIWGANSAKSKQEEGGRLASRVILSNCLYPRGIVHSWFAIWHLNASFHFLKLIFTKIAIVTSE